MKHRRTAVTIAFALCLSLVFAFVLLSLNTGTAAPAQSENAPFKGQIVAVCTDDNCGVCLWHAQVRQLGRALFW